jgi:asparagine synthase (glutamine-hydrolysing)
VRELLPGHRLRARNGTVTVERYWEVYYDLDWDHREKWFEERIEELLHDSVRMHLRSDVPVGAYVSGGLDSSAVAGLASVYNSGDAMKAFTGRFLEGPEYDESGYARTVADDRGLDLNLIDITAADFTREIQRVIYHLDFPVAGPGSFPQFMVSEAAARDVKVILGGQGGDEVFGGYTRYLIAYFEQCIKSAIEGTADSGNFVVTYESIIPQLQSLRNYKPLLQEFWKEGLFEDLDQRYFRLINRAPHVERLVHIEGDYDPFHAFADVFNGGNVGHESYFDKMTHFDFKTLLPALLQVEDRVSMAHGLESRVPLLDHPLVELAATIPADVKFPGGELKHIFKQATRAAVPESIARRTDKMGFPVPLVEWARGDARDFVRDVFSTKRDLFDNRAVLDALEGEAKFGRTFWGMFSLELWQQQFHDRGHHFRSLLTTERTT